MNVSSNTTAETLWITLFFFLLLSVWSSGMIVPQCITVHVTASDNNEALRLSYRKARTTNEYCRAKRFQDFGCYCCCCYVWYAQKHSIQWSQWQDNRKECLYPSIGLTVIFQTLLFTDLFPAYKFSSHITLPLTSQLTQCCVLNIAAVSPLPHPPSVCLNFVSFIFTPFQWQRKNQ